MKVAIGQIRANGSDIERNLEAIVAVADEARSRDCTWLVLSQDALCGPWIEDGALRPVAHGDVDGALEALARRAGGLTVVLCERRPRPDGSRAEDHSPILIADGEVSVLEPQAMGGEPSVANRPCDGWAIRFVRRPYRIGRDEETRRVAERRVGDHAVGLIEVNGVGLDGEDVLEGGSTVFEAEGGLLLRAARFETGLFVADLQGPRMPWEEEAAEERLADALSRGIEDFTRDAGFDRLLVGLSGGVDSAVVAALAVRALGAEAVAGVFLPSEFTAVQSRDDAREIARRLGIEWVEMPIERLHEAARTAFAVPPTDVVDENLQPRLRTVLLMGLANQREALVLCTGNRSEIAVGYNTLYGDTIGALAPLGDLYKQDVYRLAEQLAAVVPQSVRDRPPSAELRPGQRDDEDLPSYDVLDPILVAMLDAGSSREEMIAAGHPADVVDAVHERFRRSAYKRRQLPPAIRVRDRRD
ncbi:MAG: NAD(+) synthase [Candidatus Bipolaricaulota bacterium]|nr:MAG: NAD(+) synthase [Candidatus Bipolaricaulota bacterium]